MKKQLILAFILTALCSQNAQPIICQEPTVIDGDTFRCANLPFPIRVTTDPSTPDIWFDTPESMSQHADCPSEIALGHLATKHLQTLFKNSTLITLQPPSKPPYKDHFNRHLFNPILTIPHHAPRSLHTLFPPHLHAIYPAKQHPYNWCPDSN